MDTRKLKDRAAQALAKGKIDKALELYEELVRSDPRDLQLKVRLGDVYRRAGRVEQAIGIYRAVVDRYARDGLLLKAIAVCKIVLEVDAAHVATQQLLADLYARKYGKGGAAGAPASTALVDVPIQLTQQVALDAIELSEPELPPDAPFPAELEVVERRAPIAAGAEIAPRRGEAGPPIDAGEIELPAELVLSDEDEGEELVLDTEDMGPEAPAPARAAAPPAAAPPIVEEEDLEVVDGEELDLDAAMAQAAGSVEGDEPLVAATGDDQELVLGEEEPGSTPISLEEPGEDAEGGPPTPDQLPQIPLFSDLGKAAFIQLLETCVLRRLEPGEAALVQGETGDSFFVVVSGEVRVVRQDEGGAATLGVLEEGAFFGEMALLSGAPRVASVVATEPTELLEFGKRTLDRLVRDHPSVDQVVRKFARQRLLSNVMATSPLFRPFDRNERKSLIEKFKSRDVERGETILEEGEPVDGLYVVLTGQIAVTRKEGNRKVNLASLKEGDLFGEMSLLTKQKATATCTAKRKGTMLRLPKKVFDELILTHPQILELVAELSEERQQKTEAILSGKLAYDEDGMVLV